MAAHVAERPVPNSRQPRQPTGAYTGCTAARARAQPKIPVERRGNRRRLGRTGDPLLPHAACPIGPCVDFAHVTYHASLNPLIREPRTFAGVTLIAHLRGNARSSGGLREFAAFLQCMSEGLLTINVLARANRSHRGHSVDMIRRADGHRVDILRFAIEHLPEVFVTLGLRVSLEGCGGTLIIDIAQRNKIDAERCECGNIVAPHASDTNRGNIHRFARRDKSRDRRAPDEAQL